MNTIHTALQEYVIGDRMGDLNEGLADGLRLDCSARAYPAAGPILWSDGRQMTVDAGDSHSLIISSTGGGKTVSQIMPMLRACIKAGESLLVTDVKANELYSDAKPYLEQHGYKTWVINMRQPTLGAGYNPIALSYQLLNDPSPEVQSVGHQLFNQLADLMFLQSAGSNTADPFWDHTARDTFLGLLYLQHAILTHGTPCHPDVEEWRASMDATLASTSKLCYALNSSSAKIRTQISQMEDSASLIAAKQLLTTRLFASDSPKTSASIDTVLAQKLNTFLGSPLQKSLLCRAGLDFNHLHEKRVAVFLLLPDETDIWTPHASLIVTQLYQHLCLCANQQPKGTLRHRFNFILEEFGNLSIGTHASSLFSAGRSRNIRVTAVIQNFAQLEQRYTKEIADTIRFNCNNWIYLYSRDLSTLKELSELCGTCTFIKDGVSRPLASIAELQLIPQGQALIFQGRKRPYLTKLAPIWSYPDTLT